MGWNKTRIPLYTKITEIHGYLRLACSYIHFKPCLFYNTNGKTVKNNCFLSRIFILLLHIFNFNRFFSVIYFQTVYNFCGPLETRFQSSVKTL